MTTITLPRAVVEQALDAIESDTMLFSAWTGKMIAARTALRAALAQQDEPVEPVAWHYTNNGGCNVMHWGPSARLDADIQAAKDYPRVHKVTPLYIAPPQRKPLSEREILEAVGWERAEMWMKLAPNFPVDEARKETIKNARAIEKASWEKNHE